MLHTALIFLFWILTLLVLFTTLAPLLNTQLWWVRSWDFPRQHIAIVSVVTAALGIYLLNPLGLLATGVLVLCALFHVYRIFPYTFLAPVEIALNPSVTSERQISLVSVNVLKENDQHGKLKSLIDRERPDVLLLMETDDVWEKALEQQLARYKNVLRHPHPDHYGMVFATNLQANTMETVFLSEDNTPTVLAELEGPGGRFFFVGLHPRPPVPGNDTEERDEQMKRAAQLADRELLPVVAMGDFNDVAWSANSQRFREYGEFRDPRIGRGILASFDARSWFMRFPIDQLYLTEGIDLVSFGRLEKIGSDHFPLKAVVAFDPSTSK